MEKIDILLATYNGEKYLREQIDSILEQTYENFNLIISDDGSHDQTINILKEYVAKDNRIKVFIQEKNLGYIKNFEFLLNQVESEYYMFSDQDDFWQKNKIEVSYNLIKSKKLDLVYCDLEVVDQNLNTINRSFWKYLKIEKKVRYDDYRTEYLYNCVTGCTIISRKKYIEKVLPLPYNSEFVPHDYWIALVIAINGKIGHVNEKLIKYRQHGNNQIGTEKLSHKFDSFEQVRDLFIRVKIEHFETFVSRKNVFSEEQNRLNVQALNYFKLLKDVKCVNIKGISIFHELYKYDTVFYYLFQFVIMNIPILAKVVFKIRYTILKKIGKR